MSAITLFQEKRILLGVTGSIACYKAVDLASKLTQAGALVDVILTEAAEKFVTPLTFRSVTGRPVYTSMWDLADHVRHVGLGETADLMIVAPATANTMAKLAQGIAASGEQVAHARFSDTRIRELTTQPALPVMPR